MKIHVCVYWESYKTPSLKNAPFSSLFLGCGAHLDTIQSFQPYVVQVKFDTHLTFTCHWIKIPRAMDQGFKDDLMELKFYI